MSTSWTSIVLHGSLVQASLDNVPEYFALSYTWGSSSLTEKIYIDGRVLRITQSCADALRRMLKGQLKVMIWVDSICINQADDATALQEKSGQLALMDETYMKATQVNVHLGPGDEKSDIAMEVVKRLAFTCSSAQVAQMTGIGQEVTRRRYDKVADDALARSPEFPYGKLHGLFRLPWSRRTWVLQEVALGRKVMFYCGNHFLSFEDFIVGADFTSLPYSNVDQVARHWRTYLVYHSTLADFVRRHEQGEHVKFGLTELLFGALFLEATRPEDKVYALYGCAKRLGLYLPIPDCTKSVAQVYTEATLPCLQAGDIKLLEMVEGAAATEFGLPSWVPNFSGSLRTFDPTNPPKMSVQKHANKLVSGLSLSQWMVTSEGRRLKILGRRLDEVAAVGKPWKADSRKSPLGIEKAVRTSGQGAISLLDCIITWLDIVLQRNNRDGHIPNAVDEIAALRDLTHLLANETGLPNKPPPARVAEYLSVLIKCARRGRKNGRYARLDRPKNDIFTKTPLGDFEIDAVMAPVYLCLALSVWKLVFRTTSKAYLGTSSYSSRPGDLVVVFHGMQVPCLIRPCAEGFNFVGAAFVDGIMEGEFWNTGSEADDEWFVLI